MIRKQILKKDRNAADLEGKPLKKELSKLNKFEFLKCFLRIHTPKKCVKEFKICKTWAIHFNSKTFFHFGQITSTFPDPLASEPGFFRGFTKHQQQIALGSKGHFLKCADRKLGKFFRSSLLFLNKRCSRYPKRSQNITSYTIWKVDGATSMYWFIIAPY